MGSLNPCFLINFLFSPIFFSLVFFIIISFFSNTSEVIFLRIVNKISFTVLILSSSRFSINVLYFHLSPMKSRNSTDRFFIIGNLTMVLGDSTFFINNIL